MSSDESEDGACEQWPALNTNAKNWPTVTVNLNSDPNAEQQRDQKLLNWLQKCDNVTVFIGSDFIRCNRLVLASYSPFFQTLFVADPRSDGVIIKADTLSATGFKLAYKWMLSDEIEIRPGTVVELLRAARTMQIEELEICCWEACLNDLFSEEQAVFIYLEAKRAGDCEDLQQVMLPRIQKCFMKFVASSEFLQMAVEDLCVLVSTQRVKKSSEPELFMIVLHWLNHDWDKRQQHVAQVLERIKLQQYPAVQLCLLRRLHFASNASEINKELERILKHPVCSAAIWKALTHFCCKPREKGQQQNALKATEEIAGDNEDNAATAVQLGKSGYPVECFITYAAFGKLLAAVRAVPGFKDITKILDYMEKKDKEEAALKEKVKSEDKQDSNPC